jgi:hypothetical protein
VVALVVVAVVMVAWSGLGVVAGFLGVAGRFPGLLEATATAAARVREI